MDQLLVNEATGEWWRNVEEGEGRGSQCIIYRNRQSFGLLILNHRLQIQCDQLPEDEATVERWSLEERECGVKGFIMVLSPDHGFSLNRRSAGQIHPAR